MRGGTTKLSVNLPVEEVEALKELARARNTTMTAVLRQAIASEKLLNDEVQSGGKILIKKGNKFREIVFKS